jgi:hypothetical protein
VAVQILANFIATSHTRSGSGEDRGGVSARRFLFSGTVELFEQYGFAKVRQASTRRSSIARSRRSSLESRDSGASTLDPLGAVVAAAVGPRS